MKNVAGSGKTLCDPVCSGFAKGHSKILNVMLLLTLIALLAFAAFLISDILSFKSNASYEKSFGVFSFMNSKESGIEMKYSRDDAIDLPNQSKDQEPARHESAATNNSSREDIGAPLSSLNRSEAAKGSLARNDNAGNWPDLTAGANSSLNNASTLTGQTDGTVVTTIKPSGSDSHKSDKNKKHSFSKNDIQVNRYATSPSSTDVENQSKLNQSQLNQSQNHVNLSTNLSLTQQESHMDLNTQSQSSINLSSNSSLNLSASAPKINATEIPPYITRLEDADITSISSSNSSTNSSSNPDALSQLAMNSTDISTYNALDTGLITVPDFSAKLNASELGPMDNDTSNPDADAAISPKNEVPIELSFPELSQANSIPLNDDGNLENDDLVGEISDQRVDFDSSLDTKVDESFVDSGGMDDEIVPFGDVSSEPQYPEHGTNTGGKMAIDSPEDPTKFASPQADGFGNSDLDSAKPTGKTVSADKSSPRWQYAKNNRISNREKRDKTAKSQKRPTPPAKPARTRPVKPARDTSRD